MPLYVYHKAPPAPPAASKPPSRLVRHLLRLLPMVLITTGSILIANVAWPLIHYQLFVSPQIERSELITPINLAQTAYITPLSSPSPQARTTATPVQGQEIDYTKASNWFPRLNLALPEESGITYYSISIPQVNITDARVEIGGDDLASHLIHYPGTANPGQLGSPVIFGHSILRQFYNPAPDNPRRYLSIFSKIMTLEKGDEIYIDYDGIRYLYLVTDKFEVKPEDIYILQQRYNSRELKLVTCVPEGTYLRRGVVVATLTDINQTQPAPTPTLK